MLKLFFVFHLLPILSYSLNGDQFLKISKRNPLDVNKFEDSLLYAKSKSSKELTGNELFLFKATTTQESLVSLYDAHMLGIGNLIELNRDQSKVENLQILLDDKEIASKKQIKAFFSELPECKLGIVGVYFPSAVPLQKGQNLHIVDMENKEDQTSMIALSTKTDLTNFEYARTLLEPLIWAQDFLRLALLLEMETRNKNGSIIIPIVSASENVMKVLDYYGKENNVVTYPIPMLPFTDKINPNRNASLHSKTSFFPMEYFIMMFETQAKRLLSWDTYFKSEKVAPVDTFLKEVYKKRIRDYSLYTRLNPDWIEPTEERILVETVIGNLREIFGNLPKSTEGNDLKSCTKSECSNLIEDCYEEMITKDDWIFAQSNQDFHWNIV